MELDFLVRYKGECVAVEVKAKSGKTKSLKTVLKNKDVYQIKILNISSENNPRFSVEYIDNDNLTYLYISNNKNQSILQNFRLTKEITA